MRNPHPQRSPGRHLEKNTRNQNLTHRQKKKKTRTSTPRDDSAPPTPASASDAAKDERRLRPEKDPSREPLLPPLAPAPPDADKSESRKLDRRLSSPPDIAPLPSTRCSCIPCLCGGGRDAMQNGRALGARARVIPASKLAVWWLTPLN